MRELAKIDQVRNSKPLRDFIKLDENVEVEGFTDSNYGTTSAYRTESKRLNVESPDVTCKRDSGFKSYAGSKSKIK
jgi:hypothetical protein